MTSAPGLVVKGGDLQLHFYVYLNIKNIKFFFIEAEDGNGPV